MVVVVAVAAVAVVVGVGVGGVVVVAVADAVAVAVADAVGVAMTTTEAPDIDYAAAEQAAWEEEMERWLEAEAERRAAVDEAVAGGATRGAAERSAPDVVSTPPVVPGTSVEGLPAEPSGPPEVNGKPVLAWFGGSWWACYFGRPRVVEGPTQAVYHATWEAAMLYADGAPDGVHGEVIHAVYALWRHVVHFKGRPARRKAWEDLAPSTKRGYVGRLRTMGIKNPADQQRYYETTTDLRLLRRKTEMVQAVYIDAQQPRRSGLGAGTPQIWVSTWQEKE